HLAADFFADGTVFRQGFFADAEQPDLRFVGVRDVAGKKDGAGAADVGDPVGNQSAGTGFGDGERLAGQKFHDDLFQPVVAGAEDVVAERGTDSALRFGEIFTDDAN